MGYINVEQVLDSILADVRLFMLITVRLRLVVIAYPLKKRSQRLELLRNEDQFELKKKEKPRWNV